MSREEVLLADLLCSLDRRWRRFPAGAACRVCGERNPLSLISGRRTPICRQCSLLGRHLPATELHHPGRRPSPHTVIVPANQHPLLTFLEGLWLGRFEPGSNEAYLFDLVLLSALGPSLGFDRP
jgi:hypothetical protein